MDNLRPKLTSIAQAIVSRFVTGEGDLDTLIADTAKTASLNKNMTEMLVGITNKEYLLATNNYEFKTANINNVLSKMYETNSMKCAYLGTEYLPRIIHEIPLVKSAGFSNPQPKGDITNLCREELNMESENFTRKKASLRRQLDQCFSSTREIISDLKSAGFSDRDISTELSKRGSLTQSVMKVLGVISQGIQKEASAGNLHSWFNPETALDVLYKGINFIDKAASEYSEVCALYDNTQKGLKMIDEMGVIIG